MKKSLLTLASIALLSFTSNVSAQMIIASWSFDALLAPTADVPTVNVIQADYGSSSSNSFIYLDGTNGSSSWVSVPTNPELTTFSGSVLNDPRPSPAAGAALALANNSANGKNLVIKFSTLTLSKIKILFATRGTATGFDTHSWEWSTDNVTYTSCGSNAANKTSTWTVETVDLTTIEAINNAPAVYIRLTVSGATSASGNNRIDNLFIIEDSQSPVSTFNPADEAVNVPIGVTPTISFNEAVRKTDGSELTNADLATLVTLRETDAAGATVAFAGTLDAEKKVITVTPSANLKNNQLYYLAVGPVEDAAGNESTLKSITFTTISATTPAISVTYPNGGEVLYSGDLATITWTTTNFDAAENVKIEVYLPEGIWYTIEASTPNDGSQVVSVGPKADYGTNYLIRVSGVTNGATDESDNPFTIIATSDNLAELRSYDVNSIIKYTGAATVTYARTSNNQKYIQDATAAILIHDPGNYVGAYAAGSGITNVEGKLTLYNGLLELVPQAATGATATGPTITPATVTITNLTSDDQSKLVKLTGIKLATPTGTWTSGTNYNLDGVSSSYVIRTAFSEADYIGTAVPAGYFDAVVLVGQYNTAIQVTPRNSSDIISSPTGIEKISSGDQVKLYPVPAASILNVSGMRNLKSIEILDLAGKVIRSVTTSTDEVIRIPVSNLRQGTYMLRLNTSDGTIIKKFVK